MSINKLPLVFNYQGELPADLLLVVRYGFVDQLAKPFEAVFEEYLAERVHAPRPVALDHA